MSDELTLNIGEEQSLDLSVGGEQPIQLVNNKPEVPLNFDIQEEQNLDFQMEDESVLNIELEYGYPSTNDYEALINKPQINSVELVGNKSLNDLGLGNYLIEMNYGKTFFGTKASWAEKRTLLSEEGAIYIYTDQYEENGTVLPGIKVGDGRSCVVDLPFTGKLYDEHLANSVIHITNAEREFWNNKVRCYIDPDNDNKLIFTTN